VLPFVTSSIAPCSEDDAVPEARDRAAATGESAPDPTFGGAAEAASRAPAPGRSQAAGQSTVAGPSSAASGSSSAPARTLVARRVPFDAIPRAAWDRLLAVTARPTPFSRWTFHRAWWDGYGESAHEDYMVCMAAGGGTVQDGGPGATPLDPGSIVGIAPLMHRHEVEPDDAILHTAIRHAPRTVQTPVPDRAKAVFFAASYHADYATLLCDPADLPAVARAVVEALAAGPDPSHGSDDWDVVDLRRLRSDDPALAALESAFCEASTRHGWEVTRQVEDVCPVLHVAGRDWETYLQTLGTKDRHEVRRKVRRAEAAGPVEFEDVHDPSEAVDEFIAIHQARWDQDGLFPDTEGGARSRRFFRRLAELEGPGGVLRIGRLRAAGRVIFMCVGFHEGDTVYYYNAGNDPEAHALSPGVVGVAFYLRHGLEQGTRVFDFLRGDEGYKYRWGAVDEPIHRLIVTRRAG
jgi:Acetyltransferase (GNAT) domain